ncbi:DNRLRE domain-containing protein [Streptomyces cyaneofuscatus]|uniref:DNRLRE domain-containing protein n=1 Tax=Streptomyces cyaneofuscatus TaxID=66883 RepID=A0ABZ1ETS9_9ACTN|nr:DNRLRE domain-containing protein [Streptomyces cyaneofuscatus]WSB07453.1 DNRLRE domain-containing protein [Streptomyces cyaneofuscatus]WSD49014.1 DNRLRE domain-containing protein [Streptomyces cyaneofuscatus]
MRRLRPVAVAVSLLMAVEAAVVVSTSGQAVALPGEAVPKVAEAAGAAKELGPATADSESAARLKARMQDRRIEVLGARTETSTVYVNPNGTVTEEAYAGPVRFEDDRGQWQTVDPSLREVPDGSLEAVGHPHDLKVGGRHAAPRGSKGQAGKAGGASVPLVSLEDGTGRSMELGWFGALPAPVVEGEEDTVARYKDALPATDLLIESTRTGFEQFLELKDRSAVDANGEVSYSLTAKGLTAKANKDGSVTFTDAKGGVAGVLPSPVMWDARVDERSGEHTHRAKVGVKVAQEGDTVTLTMTPDAGFLAAKDTEFPVTVDPAINIGATFDTFVQQGYGTDQSTATELKIGNNGSGQIARSFLSFPMKNITGKQITAAKLNLYSFHSWSCTPKGWDVWTAGQAGTGTRWTNQPSWGSKQATSTQTKGFSSACNDGWVNADVTAMAKSWAANGNGSNHLGLRASDEGDPYGWKRFNSGNAASRTPYLSVTYNSIPGVPTLVAPAHQAATNDTTPTLSAKAIDGDGGQVRLDHEVWLNNGTAALRTGSTANVASGAPGTWTPAALPEGVYKWRSRAGDGSANSAWSAFRTLTVDTKAPAVSKIASGDFPAGQWSGTPDDKGDFTGAFTLTPPATDVRSVQWKIDSGAWQETATTGAAVTVRPVFRAGKHTLTARTKDAAGNVSAQSTHTFYAGSGAALLAPGDGDRPARRSELSAQGKTTDTGVRFQYRRGETDTWKDVPVAHVRRKADGSTPTAWPAGVTAGLSDALTWNVTDTLTEDGAVEVRALFTDGTLTDASPANGITVDRNAGQAPSEEAGPGTVNLLTGDFGLSATDASGFDLSATRSFSSRRPAAGSQQDGQAAIFGPQWTGGTVAELTESDWVSLRRTSASSVALVDVDGDEVWFTAAPGGTWKAETGAEALTLTGSLTGSFTLKESDGAASVFTKVDPAATTWQLSHTSLPTGNSTTTVISEKTTVAGKIMARPKYVIAPTSAATATTCAGTPSTKGCRIMEYQYATATTATGSTPGDVTGQVNRIRLWTTVPGAATATATVVSQYAYDASGRLREQWDPRISPALKTAYTYDGAGRVTTLTPSGELPWTFRYGKAGAGSVAGEGMLLEVSRPTLKAGSRDEQDGGKATTSIVYDVPLSGAKAPHQMRPADVAAWSQEEAPSDATAVFPADQVPASHDGGALSATDYGKATITYADVSGREVNSGLPGLHLTTTQYDRFGNTVLQLDATNRELALGSEAYQVNTQSELGILSDSPAERARKLSTVSVYSDDGKRKLEESGPLHLVTLTRQLAGDSDSPDVPAGTQVAARTRTVNRYDEGRPADATVTDQVTTTLVGAQVDGYPADGDVRTSTTAYDWAKGLPTRAVTDPAGLKLTRTTEYDTQGRIVKVALPTSTGTDAGATVTRYWSATGTGACAGRPEWADLACSTGPAGKITGGGGNPDELPLRTTEYDRWGNPTKVTEVANGLTRTTTTTYDAAGRSLTVHTTGGQGTATPAQTTTYAPESGAVATVSDGTTTIRHTYDVLGRTIAYDDGAGNVTRTQYDLRDRKTRVADSVPSESTYTYDNPAGLPTRVRDSVMGTIGEVTGFYDSDGRLYKQTLPWNMDVEFNYDPTGTETSRYWHWESGWTVQGEAAEYSIHDQVVAHTGYTGGGSSMEYTYDAAARLTRTDGWQAGATGHRAYTFDDNTNRTSLTTTVDDVDGGAPEVTTVNSAYDSADRLIAPGTAYDAFGRTTQQAGGARSAYYANDLVRQITADGDRTTWMLDAAGRLASWKTEAQAEDGTWGAAATTTAHYGGTDDSPDWTSEPGGGISRNVEDLAGNLIATTSATGDVALTLTNLHGDVTTLIPLVDDTTPVVNVYDEYGTPQAGTDPARYGWLGGKQRSAETPSGVVLMGVRLYDPVIGRFLSVDPVYGGNANAYDYTFADPLNQYDLDGKWAWAKNQWNRARNKATRIGRNPNWRSVYHSGKFALGAGALIHPVGRVRTARGLWRAARSPKKTFKRCGGSASNFYTCAGAGWGLQTVRNDFRNWNNNRRFRNAWNDSLTHAGRRSVCRKYTGKNSCR